MEETTNKYPVNKPLIFAIWGFVALIFLFIVVRSIFPTGNGSESNPQIIDSIFLLAIGICILTMGVVFLYYSWTLNEYEFLEWYLSQNLSKSKWGREWYSAFYELNYWSSRFIGAPFMAIIGTAMIGSALFQIVVLLFR